MLAPQKAYSPLVAAVQHSRPSTAVLFHIRPFLMVNKNKNENEKNRACFRFRNHFGNFVDNGR